MMPKKMIPKLHLDDPRSPEPETPISLSALENDWPRFVEAVRARLETGMRTYGDASFSRSLLDLNREIESELLDLMGWAFILWKRHKDLMNLIASKSEE